MKKLTLLHGFILGCCWVGSACVGPGEPADPPELEDAAAREALPLCRVIPAARDSELTPAAQDANTYRTWSRSHADMAITRYSALSQINRDNVHQLEVAWVYRSSDGKANVQTNIDQARVVDDRRHT